MVPTPRAKACAALLLSAAFAGGLLAAPKPMPTLAVPPAVEPPPTTRPAWPPIPKETLADMYRAELGDSFRPGPTRAAAPAPRPDRAVLRGRPDGRPQAARGRDRGDRDRPGRRRPVVPHPHVLAGPRRRRRLLREREDRRPPDPYFFGLPKQYDRTKPWPLVIKLPTAHAFLADPPPSAEQVAQIYTKWVQEELAAHPDAAVVMPLLNLSEFWGPSYAGMNSVMLPLQHVTGRVNVDPARVYLLGHGMSGHAAWNLALHHPTYFAAFNPLAGGASASWQRLRVANLRNVLPVVWHDADDDVMKVELSRGVVKALRLQKVDVEYDETKGIGHTPDAATAERVYQKMRGRARQLYPPSVVLQSNRPDTAFNRVDWLQVFQPVETGKERRAILRHGSGTFVYHDQSFRAEATVKGQRIEVSASNVDSLRFYLNDQMLDLTKPVTVVVNGRPRLEGLVKQSIPELLADQLFLGRGWRYHTAVVDVELTPRAPAASRPATRPAHAPPGDSNRPRLCRKVGGASAHRSSQCQRHAAERTVC
jgi:hypothetical protein